METVIHFFSYDKRFCKSKKQYRCSTPITNEVSCPNCEDNIGFEITQQGKDYLNTLLETPRNLRLKRDAL